MLWQKNENLISANIRVTTNKSNDNYNIYEPLKINKDYWFEIGGGDWAFPCTPYICVHIYFIILYLNTL